MQATSQVSLTGSDPDPYYAHSDQAELARLSALAGTDAVGDDLMDDPEFVDFAREMDGLPDVNR